MKAILVIDEMPNQCLECPCYRQVRDDSFLLEYCNANEKRLTWQEVVEVPEWCPLKPLPTEFKTYKLSQRDQEETELLTSMALLKTYADGWNDCLKEITDD